MEYYCKGILETLMFRNFTPQAKDFAGDVRNSVFAGDARTSVFVGDARTSVYLARHRRIIFSGNLRNILRGAIVFIYLFLGIDEFWPAFLRKINVLTLEKTWYLKRLG